MIVWSLDAGEQLSSFITTYRTPIAIIAIVVGAVLAHWLLRIILNRTVVQIVRGVKKSQDVEHTSEINASPYVHARAVQRTRTLGTVGRHIITWTVVAAALAAILGQLGVNLTALLASAGIVAAGLAFGAQNIVKDMLNGLFMVFEDQLGVGDSITVGTISGTVEDVGIRVTQVRAEDGTLWFIRNGEILTLGNASQGWGRAIFRFTVDADQDLEHVADLAKDAAETLLTHGRYLRQVTGNPEVSGLESVSGNRATMQLSLRTRPEAREQVRQAMRLEVRRKFREHGIALAEDLPPA